MSSILMLGGAGLMGSGTARDLLSSLSSGVTRVVVTDTSEQRLQQLQADLDDPRLQAQVLDVADPSQLQRILAECDLCINAVPTFAGHQMALFEACLRAGKTYVDYGGMGVFTVAQKAWHDRFAQAGVTAVIGLGADPGLSNVLCRCCADRLDSIDKINLYWTATQVGPANPVLTAPYALSTLLAEFANPSQQFLDGALREVPAQGGVETLQLPEPFGSTTFMFSQHSEPLTVPFARGIAEKGIREFTWRLALPRADHQAWAALVRAGFGDFDTPVQVGSVQVRPLDVLDAVMRRHAQRRQAEIPEQEGHELHFAIGEGRKDGRRARISARVQGRPDPLYAPYVDAATSMNMSIGVQQILQSPLRPGVWAAEEYFDPDAYLGEVRKRRFEVSIETQIWEEL